VNNTLNNEQFQSLETLIAIEIKKILNDHNYDVFYQKGNGVYGIIKDFFIVGEFGFNDHIRKSLYFEIKFTENITQKYHIHYGKTETENYLVPFFEALRKDIQALSNLKETN
jgi:hypothetical protein